MALQKEIELDNGIKANYHIITRAHFNFIENLTLIEVASYASKEARDKEKRLEELEASIDKYHTMIHDAEEKKDEELLESLAEKINAIFKERESLVGINFAVQSINMRLEGIPENMSIDALYKLLKTTEIYSKAKKV